ncbi:MAG: DNA primase [Proteobacteria bacterium]|nr:DNA primase [Pseudomonadota bacterium]
MAIDTLLTRLDGVKQTGRNTWRARCPSHDSKGLTLAVREAEDGRVLLHCFAMCDVHDVLNSIGLEIHDLFPERQCDHATPERRPFPAADCLRSVAYEFLIVAMAGAALLAYEPIEVDDHARLMLAVERIRAAADMAGVLS